MATTSKCSGRCGGSGLLGRTVRLRHSGSFLVREHLLHLLQELLGTLPDTSGVSRNQRLVWTWDALSLALCLDWPPHTLNAVPAADGGELDVELAPAGSLRVDVEPWPFSRETVHVRTEGRRLEGRFDSEDDMCAALRDADWTALEFELVPGAGADPTA